jgi:hypothetical protein
MANTRIQQTTLINNNLADNNLGLITPEKDREVELASVTASAFVDDNNTFTGVNTHTAEVRWHKGADLASASTIALGTTGNYHHITGNTTISNLSIKPHGTRLLFYFTESLVLGGNAFFILPNDNADISVEANSTAEFISEGSFSGQGVWKMINYLPSNASVLQTFDVTILDTTAIREMVSNPIVLVEDDGFSYLQLMSATILVNNDGTTDYDFPSYAGIIGTNSSNLRAYTAAYNLSGSGHISTEDFGEAGTYNLQLYTRVSQNDNLGGLALSAFGADATVGNRTIRVYGTYVKFAITL